MKKTLLFLLTCSFFLIGAPAFAMETFDEYSNGYDIDNEPQWSYVYGDHLRVKSTSALSDPNSLSHSDGNGALNTIYYHSGDFEKFQIAIKDLGADYGQWRLYFMDNTSTVGNVKLYNNALTWNDLYSCGSLTYGVYSILYVEFSPTEFRCKLDDNAWSPWRTHNYTLPDNVIFDHNNDPSNTYFDDMLVGEEAIPFKITDPEMDEEVPDDTWITVSGTCPFDGENRIGFTNDCLGFTDIQYTIDCSNGTFSGSFYKSGLSDRIIARDIESVSGDCLDYDDLVDHITVDPLQTEEENWYTTIENFEDYDIRIHSPSFETALTLPNESTSADFLFGFIYPEEKLSQLTFRIKQYQPDGTLLNGAYYEEALANMIDTWNHSVTLEASQTESIHYVVQLLEDNTVKRQFPFAIYVSDLEAISSPSEYGYFFPRLVEELKTKIIFNYYFAFYDGFYNLFNGSYPKASEDALDIVFKSVSGNHEYNLNITIFSASDMRVKTFTQGLRPYIVAILWLTFASYVLFRITHLFSDNN